MTEASRPQVVTLRSGDVVQVRQVRPGDGAALARAYANLGEESRYRRFFTVLPELPESTLKAAVEVDHENHEALIALPLESAEIVGIEYFTADILAENRTMLALLRSLGNVETESSGPVVTTRIEIAEPSEGTRQNLLDLLIAVARGEIVSLPVLLRRLIQVPDEFSHLIRLPVAALLRTIQRRPAAGDDP